MRGRAVTETPLSPIAVIDYFSQRYILKRRVELFTALEQDITYRFYAPPQLTLRWMDMNMRALPLQQCDVETEGGCLCKARGEERGVAFAGCAPSGRCEARSKCDVGVGASGLHPFGYDKCDVLKSLPSVTVEPGQRYNVEVALSEDYGTWSTMSFTWPLNTFQPSRYPSAGWHRRRRRNGTANQY